MASIFDKPENKKEYEVSSYYFNNETLEFDIENESFTWRSYNNALSSFKSDCSKFFKMGFRIIHQETDSSGFGKVVVMEKVEKGVSTTIKLMLIVS